MSPHTFFDLLTYFFYFIVIYWFLTQKVIHYYEYAEGRSPEQWRCGPDGETGAAFPQKILHSWVPGITGGYLREGNQLIRKGPSHEDVFHGQNAVCSLVPGNNQNARRGWLSHRLNEGNLQGYLKGWSTCYLAQTGRWVTCQAKWIGSLS